MKNTIMNQKNEVQKSFKKTERIPTALQVGRN